MVSGPEVVVVLVFLAITAHAVVSLIRPLNPYRSRKQALLGLVSVWIATAVIVAVFFPEPSRQGTSTQEASSASNTPAPSSQVDYAAEVKGMDVPGITNSDTMDTFNGDPHRKLLEVTLNIDGGKDADYLFMGATDAVEFLQKVREKWPGTFTDFRVNLTSSFADTYGRSSSDQTFEIFVTEANLKQVNWDAFTAADLLNIAQIDRRPSGDELAKAYCAVPDNIRDARRFCQSMEAGYQQAELNS